MNKSFFAKIAALILSCTALEAVPDAALEARVGAFFPSHPLVRDLYGDAGPIYEIGGRVDCGCSFNIWTSFDYFRSRGHVSACDGTTRINLFTWELGLEYLYPITCCFDGYLGLGPTIGFVDLRNNLCYIEKVSRIAAGGIAKSGIIYHFECGLFLDLFVDYLYQPIHFERTINVGGIKTGLGIGMNF